MKSIFRKVLAKKIMNFHHKPSLTRCFLAMALLMPCLAVFGQQQQQGVCARVKIEILQELTLERIGFEATLEVTNNDGADPITDFSAELTFENPQLSTNGIHDAGPLFFVRAPQLENVNDVNGGGIIGPTKKAVVRWFIIPKITAGGTSPDGIRYKVGCKLGGHFQGVELPPEILQVTSDNIFVKPEPQLEITYFQPRDVQGDDPFTPEVESPIPFILGVLVKNSGYGLAKALKINSQQPKIVENRTSLLLIAQLLGTRVNDSALNTANLLVNLGDIPPGQARKGAWDMITTLSGEFVEFKASYTHASELGGEETSVIKSLEAHFIAKEVLNDLPGRDLIRDFLADTDRDPDMVPDALYESEGNILPVNRLSNFQVGPSSPGGQSFTLTVDSDRSGWCYLRFDDPAQAKIKILSVVRSDGKTLNTNNAWTNVRYSKASGSNTRHGYFNLLDFVDIQTYTYTITYAPAAVDNVAPVTSLRFAGISSEANGRFYVTPETQMYFISEDTSPVSIQYSITNSPFIPGLPFFLRNAGEYTIRYFATDSVGNRENTNTAIIVVGQQPPDFANLTDSVDPIVQPGGALSIRPDRGTFEFRAEASPTSVDAHIDVFEGVVAWPVVANVPSSPTRATTANITVGGYLADYYKYKINSGAWSSEMPISQPLQLSGLGNGTYTLHVLARSEHGNYLAESNALQVTWQVDTAGPTTQVTGTPVTPSKSFGANLVVGGAGVTTYRWTIDNGFFRAPSGVANPIVLSNLSAGVHTVAVRGTADTEQNPVTVSWNIDPAYGSDFSTLTRIKSTNINNIGAAQQSFSWDGRNDAGVFVSPGWYTVRIALVDELQRTNFASRLVRVENLAGVPEILADTSRGARNPYGRGKFVVWQDQSSGNFEIYAKDMANSSSVTERITTGLRNQENPQTDGQWVVWQSRQINGNWDIQYKNLNSSGEPQVLTSTSDFDEINPTIEYPWVVYQRRALGATTDPWQLIARNLITGENVPVSTATQDQLNPAIHNGRLVWQDWRDVGPGEIYFKDLETQAQRRVTTNSFGQYHPVIYDNWIVWQDNRHGQVDLYGYDLLRNKEVRLTATTENEVRPYIDSGWVVAEEDSLGILTANVRLLHLPSMSAIPLTRTATAKARPSLAAGKVLWQDTIGNSTFLQSAELPAFQGVFNNQNAVVLTDSVLSEAATAFSLLRHWNNQAGVTEITRYTSLHPNVVSETAAIIGGNPAGTDFPLTRGFVWVKFGSSKVLDLGVDGAATVNLDSGVNALSYADFPNHYTAFQLARELGIENVRAVRMLDAQTGRWLVAKVVTQPAVGEQPSLPVVIGHDFAIPRVAVVLIDLETGISNWRPQ